MEAEMERKKFYNYAALAAIICVLALIIYLFLNKRETHITEDKPETIMSAVLCSANGPGEAFFTSSSANTIENEIKVLFKNDALDSLFYTYTGVYSSLEKIEHDDAVLHAKYNTYFGDYGVSPSILSPSFSTTNTKLIITLYAENTELIDGVTAKLFFINNDIINIFKGYSKEEVELYYEKQSFACKIIENDQR